VPFVVDASIVLDWALDEGHGTATAVRERLRTDDALAPALWWFELRNGLIVNERRQRLSETGSAQFLAWLARFPIEIDQMPNETIVMTFARRRRLTVYDAAYLELALRRRLPLATLDTALAEAARREGVAVLT
jgi:predicted nucleic acid-binding protein